MTVSDGDYLTVAAIFEDANGQDLVNVFGLRHEGYDSLSNSEAMDEVLEWLDDIYSVLNTHLTNTITPLRYKVDKVEWITDKWQVVEEIGEDTLVLTADPSGTAEAMISQATMTSWFPTARPKTRGRKKWTRFTIDAIAGNAWTAGALSAAASAVANMLAGRIVGLSTYLLPVIFSRVEGIAYDLAVGFTSGVAGTQRSRKPGVGS
jgi:hypothetical protein